ncbi:MAG: thiamine pyrophosphate-dependent enzyme [Candidatus Buchananbacteria bacterium]
MKYQSTFPHLYNPGHSACAGCGEAIAIRHLLTALGPNTIMTNATGCSEVTTTQYPLSAYKIPWLHSLFENAAPVASGVLAALKQKGLTKVQVVAVGGDGATYDIGLGFISALWERQENILYVCYDNEAYMNTGYQSSGATPLGAFTTTTPPGKNSEGNNLIKKDMIGLALAHRVPYIATATSAYPLDIQAKAKKSLEIVGPKYLQILTPCVPGWGYDPALTVELSKLAVQSGLYPLLEIINGQFTKVQKIKPVPVTEYLKPQKRFAHLFKDEAGQQVIAKLQQIADENIKKYNLV